jgi:uncharacterized protein (TIGR04255 family)
MSLPEYGRPPVIEVALAIQFDPISALTTAHLGALWTLFRDHFPDLSVQAPRQPSFEDLGPQRPPTPSIQLQLPHGPARVWFTTSSGGELIQVQPDRFVFNWKATESDHSYPRYKQVRASFERHLKTFLRFLEEHRFPSPEPNQCEVSYVNHVWSGDGWETFDQLGVVIPSWEHRTSDGYLPAPEDIRVSVKYRLPPSAPLGRLHINVEPHYRISDAKRLFHIRLTARGAPLRSDVEGAFAFLDIGHEWIVRGFTSFTSSAMHSVWERTT